MTLKVWSWRDAIAKIQVSSNAKLVAYTLANYINERAGQAWPSILTIAGDAALSESSVKRAIKELVSAGLIEKTKRGGTGKEWAGNLYRATFPEGVQCGPSSPIMRVHPDPPQEKQLKEGVQSDPPRDVKGGQGDLGGGSRETQELSNERNR